MYCVENTFWICVWNLELYIAWKVAPLKKDAQNITVSLNNFKETLQTGKHKHGKSIISAEVTANFEI